MSRRADRLKEHVPILDILSRYGYEVHSYNREQQFKCDLHGDGSDNAPSARVYPETASWYCFACGKSRDVISTVMEKEGLEFGQACRALEIEYDLPLWEYRKKGDAFEQVADRHLEPDELDLIRGRVETILTNRTQTRSLSLEDSLKYWEAFNLLSILPESKRSQWEKLYKAIED